MNKLGTFEMSQLGRKKSIFSDLVKSARASNDRFEENLLKVVRTLPSILKYLPSEKAQDTRMFVEALQYWLGGSPDNLENLLLAVSKAYVEDLKGADLTIQVLQELN